jgi:6-phosphogluconolactonase (cycloisomerase 2 family)
MGPEHRAPAPSTGTVYTLTNAPTGNAVARFRRAADGRLSPAGMIATDGAGTGSPLGSQGALAVSADGARLYAVNAGSATVAVFDVAPGGALTLRQTVPAGGERPISLALRQRLLYVLTAGGGGAVGGFEVDARGRLAPLSGSIRALGGGASDPAQVGFSPAGDLLVVTAKAADRIVTYAVGPDGRPAAPAGYPSSGATPFGFAFDPRGTLVVAEAHGGPGGQSAVSSYRLAAGVPRAVSPSVPTRHEAACWIAVTADGRHAYAADAASDALTGFRLGADGRLERLREDGHDAEIRKGSHASDLAFGAGERYLYVLGTFASDVSGFAVQPDGGLRPVGVVEGLAAGAAGLVAR